jgi:hypothetical protein
MICNHHYRKRLKIEQIGVRRMSFRQDEMLERDGTICLTSDPPVRNRPDVVLRRQRLEDRDGEDDLLRLTLHDLLFGQQQVLVMVDMMVDRVLNPNVKRFCSSPMDSIVPPKRILISKRVYQKPLNTFFGFSIRVTECIPMQANNKLRLCL